MLSLILYLVLVFLLMQFLLGIIIYISFLIYSSLMGSPYVPSKQKEIDYIFNQISIKKGSVFYDLGCGDGRVVRTVANKFHVNGIGYDINPVLILCARIYAKLSNIQSQISFKVANIMSITYKDADYIYMFLMPELILKIKTKFMKELKKNTIIISHGFPVIGWEKKLYKKISHIPFPTYFYKF